MNELLLEGFIYNLSSLKTNEDSREYFSDGAHVPMRNSAKHLVTDEQLKTAYVSFYGVTDDGDICTVSMRNDNLKYRFDIEFNPENFRETVINTILHKAIKSNTNPKRNLEFNSEVGFIVANYKLQGDDISLMRSTRDSYIEFSEEYKDCDIKDLLLEEELTNLTEKQVDAISRFFYKANIKNIQYKAILISLCHNLKIKNDMSIEREALFSVKH